MFYVCFPRVINKASRSKISTLKVAGKTETLKLSFILPPKFFQFPYEPS